MILEFDSVEKSFDTRTLLTGVYMRCQKGRVTGLLGRNGTGKTTLMKIIFGVGQANHKSIRIDGQPLLGNYLSKQAISYLPQDDLLLAGMSLQDAFALFGIQTNRMLSVFPEAAEMLSASPEKLSFGWRRIMECALVLFSDHPFCFLDEPFSGLAPIQIERLRAVLNQVKRDKGILLSDHLHRHVQAIADELYVLTGGRTHLVRNPKDLIRFGYLAEGAE